MARMEVRERETSGLEEVANGIQMRRGKVAKIDSGERECVTVSGKERDIAKQCRSGSALVWDEERRRRERKIWEDVSERAKRKMEKIKKKKKKICVLCFNLL